MYYFSQGHRHTLKKEIRVLPAGVEPMTFRLLVRMLYQETNRRLVGASSELEFSFSEYPVSLTEKIHLLSISLLDNCQLQLPGSRARRAIFP